MEAVQPAPTEFNNVDWNLFPGNKNHVRFLPKCIELFWLIYECQQLTGLAFFKQDWLASKLEISVRHVQNLIAELLSKNLIEVVRGDHNYYKVVEFFSHPLSYWTELAKQKAKAALAPFFRSTTSQTTSTNAQKPTSKPNTESAFKAAKPQAKAQSTDEPRPFVPASKEAIEHYEEMKDLYDANREAEKQQVEKELVGAVEVAAKEAVAEHKGKLRPSRQVIYNFVKAKLEKASIKVPEWLITKKSIETLQKQYYDYFLR